MMRSRRALALAVAWAALLVTALPGLGPPTLASNHYALVSRAAYDVRPDEGHIAVTVNLTLTNTTPDPPGQFSVFSEIKLAVHDAATDVVASDDGGDLEVGVAVENDVNVATVQLREDLRYEDYVSLQVTYRLVDSENPQLRVRPSVIVFPVWSFGTSGRVRVSIPAGYEVRVDGDQLTEEGDVLTSGDIENPSEWLALVTAVQPGEMVQSEVAVPLEGGTADVLVRSFGDDPTWGERIIPLVTNALPLIEAEVGLPYPRIGQLILTETVTADATGFAEGGASGEEILIAFDQPDFTVLHQLAHVWLSESLIESRWIREGLASSVAARVGQQLEIAGPYDPAVEATARAAAAFRLDAWPPTADVATETYGYAASWDFINQLEAAVGPDAVRDVLARVAASIGPYESGELDPTPPAQGTPAPTDLLTTRSFLDHLEAVSEADLAPLFAERVLSEADVALLEARAGARAAFDELVAAADTWGAPDPIRGAMNAWNFEDAMAQMESAATWLDERDALLADMEDAGLSPPERLQQAYRAYGGGPEAVGELDAERAVVDEYREAADEVTGERSFVERIGLVGGPDPQAQLTLASGRFTDGDLRGSLEAIAEARRMVASAEMGGVVRLASVALLVAVLVVVAVIFFRRRAAYTARP